MRYIENGWVSEYRKKKFYQNQEIRAIKKRTENAFFRNVNNRSMAVMLDLDGVSDDIDLAGASIFVRELNILRRKFNAKYCYICISTHAHKKDKIKEVLDILSKYTTKYIVIGESFFYGHTYDYETDTAKFEGSFFNTNKIEIFKKYYLNNFVTNNVWFMVADDTLNTEIYLKYKDIHPCLFVIPGRSGQSNFMNIMTNTKGFDGVIESLHEYIQNVKKLNLSSILDSQKNMICHLSSGNLIDKVRHHDIEYLIRYFEEGYADEADYYNVITWLGISNNELPDDIESITRLLNIIKGHITEEKGKSLICSLEEKWGIK